MFFFRCSWGRVTVSDELLHALLPGPVTVVFERTVALNPGLNPGSSTIGIRVPASGFVCDVARTCGEPLALTSANISAQPSSLVIDVSIIFSLWFLPTFCFPVLSLRLSIHACIPKLLIWSLAKYSTDFWRFLQSSQQWCSMGEKWMAY